MTVKQREILDQQTDIAIALGIATECWFFNGKVCRIAYKH